MLLFYVQINTDMKIWVFGDSYAVHLPNIRWTWVEKVRSSVDADIESSSVYGASVDWVYYRFEISRQQINSGDVILVVLTSLDRRWFFANRPNIASSISSGTSVDVSVDEKNAVLSYYRYLDNSDAHVLHLINWLDMLDRFAKEKNVRCLLIPAFPDSQAVVTGMKKSWPVIDSNTGIPSHTGQTLSEIGQSRWMNLDIAVGGNLFSVYQNECNCQELLNLKDDRRRNHLCRDNHIILSEKVVRWIQNRSPVVLDGFHSGVITLDILKTERWEDMELVF